MQFLSAIQFPLLKVKKVLSKYAVVLVQQPALLFFSRASLVQQTAEASWQKFLKQESSFVTDVIAGQLESSLECKVCGHQSRTYESFFQLSLPLPDNVSGKIEYYFCFSFRETSYRKTSNEIWHDCLYKQTLN